MNYADRVKATTEVTSTTTITLTGTAAGYRPFLTAPIIVGAKRIPVVVVAANGEWEAGWYTLTNASTLTRESIVSSSSGNGAVAFPAGVKDVICTPVAAMLAAGLTDPDDVGFDIIGCFGQSNMQNYPTSDPLIDVGDPGRVYQWANFATDSATYRKIITATGALYQPNGIQTDKTGLAQWAAKAYLGAIPQNRKVLLVPCAVGSTGMVGAFWAPGTPGGQYYERAITEANLAIAAALLLYPNSRYVGTWFAQGEADGLNGTTQAQYATACKGVIAGIRTRVTGAANSWFIIAGMTPEGIAAHTGEVAIDAAHTQVAAETDRCVKVAAFSGYAADVHWTAPGARMMGTKMGLAVELAKRSVGADVTAPVAVAAAVANATPTKVTLTLSEALNESFTPAASTMAVSGHSCTGLLVMGASIELTVSAFVNGEAASTVIYTPSGTNNIRDLAGNQLAGFSMAVTNNVLPVDTTPPVFVSAQVADATPTVIQVTMSEALAAVVPAASTLAASGGRTVTGVAVNGAGFSITVTPAVAYGDTVTFQYVNPGSGNRLQDAAGNMVLSFGPSAVANNVGAPATAPGAPTIGTATAGDGSVSVAFTAGSNGGSAITGHTASLYKVSDNTFVTSATGASSPINVTGAANGVAVYAKVKSTNAIDTGVESAASNNVTPAAIGGGFTTFNPSDIGTGITLSNGNLTAAGTAGFKSARAVAGKATGKWQVEYRLSVGAAGIVGMGKATALLTNFSGSNANSWGYYTTGAFYFANVAAQTNTTWTTNDIIGMAVDLDNLTIQFYKNGVAQGTAYALKDNGSGGAWVPGTMVYPMASPNGTTIVMNAGATAFTYPISGFNAWTA